MVHDRMPELLGEAMGNECFVARFKTKKELNEFAKMVFAKPGTEK